MPRAACGGAAPRAGRGFTLIELLVTLLVMALLTGLAALALPRGDDEAMQRESDRLAALLDAARQRAAAAGTPLAWAADARGYTFLQPSPAGWVPLNQAPLQPHAWAWLGTSLPPLFIPRSDASLQAGSVGVLVEGGSTAWGAAPSWLVFGTEPVAAPMRITLTGTDRVVTIDSDGLAPFATRSAR
jgi:general secretion pathway protein H